MTADVDRGVIGLEAAIRDEVDALLAPYFEAVGMDCRAVLVEHLSEIARAHARGEV